MVLKNTNHLVYTLVASVLIVCMILALKTWPKAHTYSGLEIERVNDTIGLSVDGYLPYKVYISKHQFVNNRIHFDYMIEVYPFHIFEVECVLFPDSMLQCRVHSTIEGNGKVVAKYEF